MILLFKKLVLFAVRFLKEPKFEVDNIFAIRCNVYVIVWIMIAIKRERGFTRLKTASTSPISARSAGTKNPTHNGINYLRLDIQLL
jgi:hypothetical protein